MRKSREFENVLDECLERLLAKGETLEQCLRSFPEHTEALKPLLEIALDVNKVSAIQPRPEFRDKARSQFSSALDEMERKRSRSFFSWRWQPRLATVVAIVLALLLAGGGTVAAASGSMPDEPLYPVKLASEQARLVLTPSALGKAEFYAKLVDRRVIEIVRMADENKPEKIERTARRLDAYLARIAVLVSAQRVPGGRATAPAVEEALVAEKVPAASEAPAPVPTEQTRGAREAHFRFERRAKFRAIMVRHATNHPARLRALLKTVPQSTRPALLRAIAVSETGYKKALKSLD